LAFPPFTATVTVNPCSVVMLDADGVTTTAGINAAVLVTVTKAEPDALV
jgi:hypothetical protein